MDKPGDKCGQLRIDLEAIEEIMSRILGQLVLVGYCLVTLACPASAGWPCSTIPAIDFLSIGLETSSPENEINTPPSLLDQAGSRKPAVIHSPPAQYPQSALRSGSEGLVDVEVEIDPSGQVVDAQVNWSDTTWDLEEAALTAARQFVFRPGRQNQMTVSCRVIIPFSFVLE